MTIHNAHGLDDQLDLIPRQLHISDPADLMAYVRHTLGFVPRNSFVAIAVSKTSLGAVLRCDFPARLFTSLSEPDPESTDLCLARYGEVIAQYLSHDAQADRSILLYVCDEYGDSGSEVPAPWSDSCDLIGADECLRHTLERAGLPVLESLLFIGRMLWHVYCPEGPDCEIQAVEIGDPDHSLVADSLTLLGSQLTHREYPLPLPMPVRSSPSPSDPMFEMLPEENDAQKMWEWLMDWDQVLRGAVHPRDVTDPEWLSAGLNYRMWRDGLLMSTCFGLNTAVSGMLALGCAPSDLEYVSGYAPDDEEARWCTQALVGTADRAPEWQRIAILRVVIDQLLPMSKADATSALGALAVWIEWARGRGSVAQELLQDVLEYDSKYSLTLLLDEALQAGLMCRWALHPETAWSATKSITPIS